jgi:5-methyltetrahydrofolate--homocysteine methyltransferase
MTTTVPAMEVTIRLLRAQAPWCKILVGGAVLTQRYADEIGADAYCPDAMAGVRAACSFLNKSGQHKPGEAASGAAAPAGAAGGIRS